MSYLFYAGLDLGQAADYTALAVLEEPVYCPPMGGWIGWTQMTPELKLQYKAGLWYHWKQAAPSKPPLWLRQLYRYPLRTPYPDIVSDVKQRLNGAAVLVVDGTGVGAAVVDMFRYAKLPCDLYPVIITGGVKVERNHIPKRDLIGAVQVLLQSDRLHVTQESDETKTWATEMQNYQLKLTATGHDTYNARTDSIHDDLVLAAGLACYYRHAVNRGE